MKVLLTLMGIATAAALLADWTPKPTLEERQEAALAEYESAEAKARRDELIWILEREADARLMEGL